MCMPPPGRTASGTYPTVIKDSLRSQAPTAYFTDFYPGVQESCLGGLNVISYMRRRCSSEFPEAVENTLAVHVAGDPPSA